MKKIKMLTVIAIAAITLVNKAGAQKKPPAPPPPVPTMANNDAHTKMNAFLENNPAVKDVYLENKNLLVVELKNGKIEKYNIADSDEKKKFINQYGKDASIFLPVPLPPPPPPPPPAKPEAI